MLQKSQAKGGVGKKAQSKPSNPRKKSELASFRQALIRQFSFPDDSQLSQSGAAKKLIIEATEMRAISSKQNRKSQHRELSQVYHVGLYLIRHERSWEKFCADGDVKKVAFTDCNVLRSVLLGYTGTEVSGVKNASRYHRALRSSFEERVEAKTILRTLGKGGRWSFEISCTSCQRAAE